MWFRRLVDVAFVIAVVLGVIVLVAAFLGSRRPRDSLSTPGA